MKAVILQGPPAWTGPEDLEISHYMEQCIKQIPEISSCSMYYRDHCSQEQLNEWIGNAEILIGYRIREGSLSESFFQNHPNLRYIGTLAMGYGDFNRDLTRQYGVTITNTVYGSMTIAEYTMALLMEICHGVHINSQHIKSHDWSDKRIRSAYMQSQTSQMELYGKIMGIYGLGNIGFWVAKMAYGFGMKVIASSRTKKEGPEYAFIEQVSPEELLERSDVLSLHLPVTNQTYHMINDESIAKMKTCAILLNTARGALVDEEALSRALKSGRLYAAGLDCLTEEPATRHTPLMDCENAVITGHIAWYPKTSRLRAVKIAVENLKAFLDGKPQSVINL